MRYGIGGLAVLSAAFAAYAVTPAVAATDCADLAKLALPDAKITSAEMVTSGQFAAGRQTLPVPQMCRVAGTVAPAIKFEVWLPTPDKWNGRFEAVGGGGLAGRLSYPDMAKAVSEGYATASTDTGHEASDNTWLYDSGKRRDFGYRSIHEMTVKAKAIIEAHYGKAQDHAYFNGCSTGGRQALSEAQMFPADYDGIVAGDPEGDFVRLHMQELWGAWTTLREEGTALSKEDLTLLGSAVMDACDAGDGVKDGILSNPASCHFDPAVLECKGEKTASCLTAKQIDTVKKTYRGAYNPRTNEQIYPGPSYGSEAAMAGNPGWGMTMNGRPFSSAVQTVGDMGLNNPKWDWKSFDYDKDADLVNKKLDSELNSVNPDLGPFEKHGGKIVLYHGWVDALATPQATIDYYNDMIAFRKRETGTADPAGDIAKFARLFMVPGLGHCNGGAGPGDADFLATVVSWVEEGKAPDTIIAAKKDKDGKTEMTRPLCTYPKIATYKGSGDTNDAANFQCK